MEPKTLAQMGDSTGIPLYTQLHSLLLKRLEAGEWPVGSQMPTLEALMEEYGVSRVTVREAMARLEREDTAVQAIRAWWPGLGAARLSPDYAGVRPRRTGPGQPPDDWRIDGPAAHGVPGIIHLFGIDTPGLTACLALADHVAGLVQDQTRSTRSSAA